MAYQWKKGTWRRCIGHTFPLQSAFLKNPLEVRPLSSPTRAFISDVSLAFSFHMQIQVEPTGISGPELHTIGNAFQKSKISRNKCNSRKGITNPIEKAKQQQFQIHCWEKRQQYTQMYFFSWIVPLFVFFLLILSECFFFFFLATFSHQHSRKN